jgi:uncharacterized membrane protein required for colicin V production
MNWIDGILLIILLGSVIVGSKKGLIRELMAFIIFFTAVIVSVNYIDSFAVWMYDKFGGSPLISAFLSFITLLALSYALFKVLGIVFYRIADLKSIGRKDQMGGALVGFLRGWVAVGFITLISFLLPMPDTFYESFENSFFGPAVAKTIPLMYEGTAKIHPDNPKFMDKMEQTLLEAPSKSNSNGKEILNEDKVKVHKVLYQMEKFFAPADNKT